MKKLLVGFVFTFFLCTNMFAKVVTFFDVNEVDTELKQTFYYNYIETDRTDGVGLSTRLKFDLDQLVYDFGFFGINGKSDFTTELIYWPSFFGKLNLGVGFSYHLYSNPELFIEHDFLPGVYAKWKPNPYFELFTRFCFMEKVSVIAPGKIHQMELYNGTLNFNLALLWAFSNEWKFYVDFSSNSYFEYPMFCTPFFSSGIEKCLFGKLYGGMELTSEWVDMFTISANMTTFTVQAYLILKL